MLNINSLNASAHRAPLEIETPRANSFVDVELGNGSAAPSHDGVEQPKEPEGNRRRKAFAWGLGGLLAAGAGAGITLGVLLSRRHHPHALVPTPAPALPPLPDLAPVSVPSAPQPTLVPSVPELAPQPASPASPELAPQPTVPSAPDLAPTPQPAQPEAGTPPTPAPDSRLPTQPHSDAFKLSPYAKPQSSGQVTAGEFVTLVVSTNGNACGQVRRDPAHTLTLQMARPRMGTLIPGTYASIGSATAPEDMANVASAPSGLTGFAGLEQAFGNPAPQGNDLQVVLTSVSHSGGNITGTFSLTVNGSRQRGDFNAASCDNLLGGV